MFKIYIEPDDYYVQYANPQFHVIGPEGYLIAAASEQEFIESWIAKYKENPARYYTNPTIVSQQRAEKLEYLGSVDSVDEAIPFIKMYALINDVHFKLRDKAYDITE